MTNETQLRQTALEILAKIAPEADLVQLDPTQRFRDQFAFDSMDFLNFATGLQETLKIEIPETDYPQLSTLDSCVAYLASKSRL